MRRVTAAPLQVLRQIENYWQAAILFTAKNKLGSQVESLTMTCSTQLIIITHVSKA